MSTPLISVIMPVRNTPPAAIALAVQSLRNQILSKDQFELIVVNDGSEPEVAKFLDTLQGEAHGFRLRYRVSEHVGQSVARNTAALASRAEYLAFLDADDAYFSHSLVARLSMLATLGADMVWTPFIYRQLDREGNTVSTSNVRYDIHCKSTNHPYSQDDFFFSLQDHNVTLPLTVMMKRSAFIECGGFEPDLVCSEDWLLWRRIAENKNMIVTCLPEPTGYYQSWLGGTHQSQALEMHPGGFHLDTNHPAGRAGEYLDRKASQRAASWKAQEKYRG